MGNLSDDEATELFRDLERGQAAARNALAEHYSGFANALARRFERRADSASDLAQVAQVALILALDRYEPSRGTPFEAFAAPTIIGEIKRHFRDKGWSVRVPRRIQELHLRIRPEIASFTQENGRSPTPAELADRVGVEEDDVLEAMEASNAYHAGSLDMPSANDPAVPAQDRDARLGQEEAGFERVELRLTLRDILAELPDRERDIVSMRFVDNLTQAEIAERIGVSQMHISRLLARTLERLRARLEP